MTPSIPDGSDCQLVSGGTTATLPAAAWINQLRPSPPGVSDTPSSASGPFASTTEIPAAGLLDNRSETRAPGVGIGDHEPPEMKTIQDCGRRADVLPPPIRDYPDVDGPRGWRQGATDRLGELVRVGTGIDQDLMSVRRADQDRRAGAYIQRVDVNPTIWSDQQQRYGYHACRAEPCPDPSLPEELP